MEQVLGFDAFITIITGPQVNHAFRKFLDCTNDVEASQMIENVIANLYQVRGMRHFSELCQQNLRIFWELSGGFPWPFHESNYTYMLVMKIKS